MAMVSGAVVPASAQSLNGTTYPFSSGGGESLEDMSTGTTQLLGADLDDQASSVHALGFDFWFMGNRYADFSVNSNGLMRLGSGAVSSQPSNNLASFFDSPKIAPYWDDIHTGTNGQVHYKVVGTAPARKLVVEWSNMQVPRTGSGNAGAATFQCWLHESTGLIDLVYGTGMGSNAVQGGASVGIANSFSAFASVTVTGPAVSYSTANNANVSSITSGTRYTFAPLVPTAPTGLTFPAVGATAMTGGLRDLSVDR
jgi:hypothetical protein